MNEHYRDPPGPKREQSRKHPYGVPFRMATINVASILKVTMHHQLETFMQHRDIQVLALTETRVGGSTKYVVGDVLYILSSQ
eukprot:8052036-Alexandrium_andersonii.AAC.1